MKKSAHFEPLHPAERARCADERAEIMGRLGMTDYENRREQRAREAQRTRFILDCIYVVIFVVALFIGGVVMDLYSGTRI